MKNLQILTKHQCREFKEHDTIVKFKNRKFTGIDRHWIMGETEIKYQTQTT